MGFSKAEEISPLPANLCLFICSSNMSLLVLWHGNCTASKRKVGGGQHGERERESSDGLQNPLILINTHL